MYPKGTKAYEAEQAMRYGPVSAPETSRVQLLAEALHEARENMKAACMSVCDKESAARIAALDTWD